MQTYERIVKFTWNGDSVRQTQDAIYSLVGLARELTEHAHGCEFPDHEWDNFSEWHIPAELSDEWEWLNFAIERIEKLGHKVLWDDGYHNDRGYCTVTIKGTGFPFLLGRDSLQDAKDRNRTKIMREKSS